MTRGARRDAGFTMMETLLAILLLGVIVAAIGTMTSQWLRNWDRGLGRVQSIDMAAGAIERIVADLAGAEFIAQRGAGAPPDFEGAETGVSFVRTPIGPNAYLGLEAVRIAEQSDGAATALVRSTAAFTPSSATAVRPFGRPVVLARGYRASFAYAGADGQWRGTWINQPRLPHLVRISLRAGTATLTTVATVRAELPPRCAAIRPPADCVPLEPSLAAAQPSGPR